MDKPDLSHPDVHADPGLQPERTTLAWSRTALALLLVGMLHLRFVHHYGAAVIPVLVVVLALAVTTSLTHRPRHRRGVQGVRDESLRPAIASVLLLGLGVLALSATSLLVVLGDAGP